MNLHALYCCEPTYGDSLEDRGEEENQETRNHLENQHGNLKHKYQMNIKLQIYPLINKCSDRSMKGCETSRARLENYDRGTDQPTTDGQKNGLMGLFYLFKKTSTYD